ncbi:MAG: hypothetical protein Ct9H300mP29_2140 [Candidatus Neomarinimicrobiota bacterium]|nr:MAG: hypothetical protein Ct9H300mP29_2140 [Candidatus Neomarinimicrobiota bacterium]
MGFGSKNNRVDDATSTAYFIEDQFNIQNFTKTAGAGMNQSNLNVEIGKVM